MKKIFVLLMMAVFLFPACNAAAVINIKLAVVTKPGSAQNIVAGKFKELIEKRSHGDIKVKIFHSASLGNETEILQQVQMNSIQMAIITGGPFDTFDPMARVINYPFLFKDYEDVDRILDGPLGANPTPMPWPIYTELEQGVIDGQENPLWVMEVYRFYQIQKYMTLTRHVYSYHIDAASLSWWDTLDARTREMIQKAMVDAAVYQRKDNRGKNAARLQFLKDKGMQVEAHPDLSSFRARVAGIRQMDLYRNPEVQALLQKILAATK